MITKKIILHEPKQKIPFVLARDQVALLMPIGDIHFGAPDFPLEDLKRHLEWGMERSATFVGMGDYLEFTPESQRKIMASLRDSVLRELDERVKERIASLGDLLKETKGCWLGLIEGNHKWIYSDSRSSTQDLCRILECDYLGDSAMLRLVAHKEIKNHPEADLILYIHHGTGSSQLIGGQLNIPERTAKYLAADLVLMGHTHSKIVGGIDKLIITPDGIGSHRTTIVARTGAFLKAYTSKEPFDLDSPAYLSEGSYVEKKALVPSSMGGICVGIGRERIPGSAYWRPLVHYSV